MPSVATVRDLYRAASAEPPLSEPEAVADLFARLYGWALDDDGVIAAVEYEDGKLVGFAYGHPWTWARQTDGWAEELRARLGAEADRLDGTFSLVLLARDPHARGRGIGRNIVRALLDGIGDAAVWLQTTDIDSPARRLYESEGFTVLGHGPDAPDGRPGLVMYRPATGSLRA